MPKSLDVLAVKQVCWRSIPPNRPIHYLSTSSPPRQHHPHLHPTQPMHLVMAPHDHPAGTATPLKDRVKGCSLTCGWYSTRSP